MNKCSGMRFVHVIIPYKNKREIDGQKVYVTIYLYIDPFLLKHKRWNYEPEGENHPIHILLKTPNVNYKHRDYIFPYIYCRMELRS